MSPSVSGAQHRAMEAAAGGNSTLGIPQDVGEEFSQADAMSARTGMPVSKKRHRGSRSSAGPGGDHHRKLNQAMAAGDHASAQKHALNLGNALTKHLKGVAPSVPRAPAAPQAPQAPSAPQPPQGTAFLARALMGRK